MSRQPFVYLAGPINKGDKWNNFTVPSRLFKLLLQRGIYSYVPQWSMLFDHIYQLGYEDWMNLDFQVIRRCDGLIRLSGESAGADREVALAEELKIPILFTHGSSLEEVADAVKHYFDLE